MSIVFTDRSRIETYQHCKRQRWWEYHEGGRGIVPARKSLPLCVGGSVHVGLAELLRGGDEASAVRAALADFATHLGALDVDMSEQAGIRQAEDVLGVEGAARAKSDFDSYLYLEQSALVEALVRAYARRRLHLLLEQYEVLEVEREGEWELGVIHSYAHVAREATGQEGAEQCDETCRPLWFASRPDALLLERASGGLYILSYKTAASWDIRKERDAEHDSQGLSEGVEIEKRLGDWWRMLRRAKEAGHTVREVNDAQTHAPVIEPRMLTYLRDECPAPPRILGIRYEYIFKGERRQDRELSARLGMDVRSQRSHLIRGYRNAGMTDADAQWNWSFEYLKPTGEESRLYAKNWPSVPVWETMPVARWIDMLDEAAMVVSGDTGAELGYGCPAQTSGTTRLHPLDSVFHPPMVAYRSDDQLRDWLEQTEAQEAGVAQNVARVNAAGDEAEKRSLLNVLFSQSRRACVYPSLCPYEPLCFGGETLRADPVGSGRYKMRKPNHPQEEGNHAERK